MIHAEQYLIKLLYSKSGAKSFNDLRYEEHIGFKPKLPPEMSPTSGLLKYHILCAIYATYLYTTILNSNKEEINPLDFGFVKHGDILVPQRVIDIFPPEDKFPTFCKCRKNCSTKKCKCVLKEIPCISFCKCQKSECVNYSDDANKS